MEFHFEEGEVLLIDKPESWTSFDVVKKIRVLLHRYRGIRKIKVGHAGTLDPLATGLLICCTGKATKEIPRYQNLEKEYIAGITLGMTTPSFDLETEPDKTYPVDHITVEKIRETLQSFTGPQEQIPPAYSAKNVQGIRAYQLAREGKKFELKPQQIEIKKIELIHVSLPEFKIRVVASKGTYIRSLVRDIGFALNSGAVMSSLRRTSTGPYNVEQALTLEKFELILKKTEQN